MSVEAPIEPRTPSNDYSLLAGSEPCRFWHRLFAFLIDSLIVAIPCFTVAEVFRSYFVRTPELAAIVGLAIVVCYFGFFGSRIVDGQTLGMMTFGIKVVARDGEYLTLSRSFIRYLILFVPFVGDNLLPLDVPYFLAIIYQYALSAVGFSIFYLAVFNQKTGQSVHDLATDAFVVDSPGSGAVRTGPFWKLHWAIVVAILGLGFVASIAVSRYSTSFEEVKTIQHAVSQVPVGNFDVSLTFHKQYSEIIVEADCNRLSSDHNAAAVAIAAAVLRDDAQAVNHEYLAVNCVSEVRVGLFRSTTKETIMHTPQEWRSLTH